MKNGPGTLPGRRVAETDLVELPTYTAWLSMALDLSDQQPVMVTVTTPVVPW